MTLMSSRRSIQTLLFTDIVESTVRAAEMGDRRWKALLDDHHARVRAQLRRFGGREAKELGDGFLAVFENPSGALRAAWAACRAVKKLDLEIRAGIHTGAVESDGDDLRGIAVHIAARIQTLAAPGQILVSHVTRALETGSGFVFDDLGEHHLKGVPEAWRLFALMEVSEQAGTAASTPDEVGAEGRRIAVLPFQNLSGVDEPEPFAAGLHDDLLTQLSKISALTVISRTSVMGYRGTEKPVPQIARELGVGTVVEGGVQQAGDRIRLNVKLIDAHRDSQRWAESYDRRLSTENIFDIQADLARKIAETVRAELTSDEQRRVGGAATAHIEAYRLYVQGRTNVDQRSEHGMRRALDYFRRAIELDAAYALAWAGLADAVNLLEWYGYGPPESSPDPERAARRAVELDPDSGEARTSLGIFHAVRREGKEAIEALMEAVKLAPSFSEGHVWLGWVQLVAGHPEEALESLERSLELDPLAPAVRVFLAAGLLAHGKPSEALLHLERALDMEPEYGLAHHLRGVVLHHRGDHTDSREALERARGFVHSQAVTPSDSEMLAAQALTSNALGDDEEARRLVASLEEDGEPFWAALVHAALGEEDEAWSALARATDWNPFAPETLRYFYPRVLDPLRDDPRFEQIVADMERNWGLDRANSR